MIMGERVSFEMVWMWLWLIWFSKIGYEKTHQLVFFRKGFIAAYLFETFSGGGGDVQMYRLKYVTWDVFCPFSWKWAKYTPEV